MNFIDVIVLAALLAGLVLGYRKLKRWRKIRRYEASEGKMEHDYPVRTDWTRSAGKVNVSSFIYFDTDRDGSYTLGDRPLAGIHVRLYRDQRHLRRSASNINGFANFVSSTKQRDAPIREPGQYRFSVSVPPGWICTSGNHEQTATFKFIMGSPAGIGAEQMMTPVGLAPIRWVHGTSTSDRPLKLLTLRGDDMLSEHDLVASEAFELELSEDADAIRLTDGKSSRTLDVGSFPINLGNIADIEQLLDRETATRTITFDDHTIGNLKKIPNGYSGLNWFNLNIMSREFTPASAGYANGTIAGNHSSYTSSGHPAEIYLEDGFAFQSMLLTNAWGQSDGETVTIECWDKDLLVRKDDIKVKSLTPVSYAPMLKRVTRVRISSKRYWQIAIGAVTVGG